MDSHDTHQTEITATLDRLTQLVESSPTDANERQNILTSLVTLRQEVDEHFASHALPDTFHAILQDTESYVISRLGNDSPPDDDLDISWQDLGVSIQQSLRNWEAKHPRLSGTFMRFMNILSRAGV